MAFGITPTPYGQVPGAYPSGILLSVGGRGTFMQPNYDQQFNTRGEPGYYTDTPLGAPKVGWLAKLRGKFMVRALGAVPSIPTDAELSSRYQFTPVHGGWVSTDDGYAIPSPWLPPNGYRADGIQQPVSRLSGFGLAPVMSPPPPPSSDRIVPQVMLPPAPMPAPVTDPSQPASVNDVLLALQAHNDRIFALQVVASTAVAVSALITIFRTIKLIRSEHGRGAE